jgi:hypothetical protein
VFIMSNPLVNPPRELVERGAEAVSAQDNRWHRCDIKSISLIGNVLLRQLSADAGAAETILFREGSAHRGRGVQCVRRCARRDPVPAEIQPDSSRHYLRCRARARPGPRRSRSKFAI